MSVSRVGSSWMRERLAAIPDGEDVALILRHAERYEIPPGEFGADVPLTARGVASAERLGEALGDRARRAKAAASPLPRCVQTAEAILRGGGWRGAVELDRRLGDPGAFVADPEVAGALFMEIGILELVRRQLDDAEPPDGMRATAEGVSALLELAAGDLGRNARLSFYVTHDSILAVLVAWLYELPICEIGWPNYLDGLLLWRASGRLQFAWKGLDQASHPIRR